MMFIEFFLSFLIVFLVYRILLTSSSVESVLFLILLAINFSMLLFFYEINFLAILYLAVYIGAVTVFFLFVVMMTDINNSWSSVYNEFSTNQQQTTLIDAIFFKYNKIIYLIVVTFLSLSVSNFLIILLERSKYNSSFFEQSRSATNFIIDRFNLNIEFLGFSIFNEHAGPFVISSIIILIALIGSIFITTLVTEAEASTTFSTTPVLMNTQIVENNKSQEMEIQSVRQFLNSIYLNINK